MPTRMKFFTLAILVLGAARPAVAQPESKVNQSILAFNLAVDRARKDQDACKQAVMTPLKDARDSIQKAATVVNLTHARRTVEDLVDGPASVCGDAVKKELQRALDRLSDAITELSPNTPAASNTRSTSVHPNLEAAKQCWNYVNAWTRVDPGCAHTKAGNPPWNRLMYEKLKGGITTAGDRFERTSFIEKLVGEQKIYLTCLQLNTLLPLFSEETDKIEIVKSFAPGLVDPHNASMLGQHIRNMQARKDMLQTVAEHQEAH